MLSDGFERLIRRKRWQFSHIVALFATARFKTPNYHMVNSLYLYNALLSL